MAPLSVCSTGRAALSSPGGSALNTEAPEAAKKEECEKLDSSMISCDVSEPSPQNDQAAHCGTHSPLLNQPEEYQSLEVILTYGKM